MPQEVLVVFLLFFAVLAFAWFYLQRAKARTAPPSQTTESPPLLPGRANGGPRRARGPRRAADHAEHADHSRDTGAPIAA